MSSIFFKKRGFKAYIGILLHISHMLFVTFHNFMHVLIIKLKMFFYNI
jgi:hypothetical protein